jgi:hypothetical protein
MHHPHPDFRSNILIIIIVVLLLLFCNTMVSAADISLGISGTINDWKLATGQDNTNEALSLTVVADTQPWYIKVRDALDDEKPVLLRVIWQNGMVHPTSPVRMY